jgi:glycerol-3-phosphate dehydrogenase
LNLVPELADIGMSGAAVFHDAQIQNTERLVLEIIRAASESGAVVANHVELEEAILENGSVAGARLRDSVTGARERLRTRAIINAAGAQSTEVDRRLHVGKAAPDYPRAAAINVMLPGRGLRTAVALEFHPHGDRRARQIMWAPWRDREIVGTHHMIVPAGDPFAWRESDATAFLADLGRTLPALDVRPEDVLLVHAGLLPLDRAAGGDPTGLLRRHRIFDRTAHGARGVISAVSVRYTTARATAERAVDMAVLHCGRAAGPCRTALTPLPSAPASPADLLAHARASAPAIGLPDEVIEHLVCSYGSRYQAIIDEFRECPGWNERVEPGSPVIAAELLIGVRNEMALSVPDLLYRRVELGSRGAVDGRVVETASAILSAEIGGNGAPFEPQRPPWPRAAAVAREAV